METFSIFGRCEFAFVLLVAARKSLAGSNCGNGIRHCEYFLTGQEIYSGRMRKRQPRVIFHSIPETCFEFKKKNLKNNLYGRLFRVRG
jgi:hypothetical protein